MRDAANPEKGKLFTMDDYTHQVIIPVYIPNHEDYFRDGLRILKICINSLLNTSHDKTYVTIVNNGSHKDVIHYLNTLLDQNKIHEVIHTANVGKINGVIKGLKGHFFDLVTVSDADVFFKKGWQNETVKVFNAFPKAGVVGVVPQFRLYSDLCYNLLYDNFFSKKLKFEKVKNPQAMEHFYNSIGWTNLEQAFLDSHLTLSNNDGFKAVVGSGHFVATYKNAAFQYMPQETCQFKINKGERLYFDEPVLKTDSWRLTTTNNYAYHMGNVHEPWMDEELSKINASAENPYLAYKHANNNSSSSKFSFVLKNKLFAKFFKRKPVLKWFLKNKKIEKHNLSAHV
jgi:hypothetical protein